MREALENIWFAEALQLAQNYLREIVFAELLAVRSQLFYASAVFFC